MNTNTVTIGEVRFSYCNLFQPYAANANEEPLYSVTALIPKPNAAALNDCYAAIEAAKAAGISTKWNGAMPPVIDITLRDGDGPRPSDGSPYGEECKGHMVLKCKSKQRPFVVDANVQDIIDPSKVYSGCYGRVNVTFIAYNNNGKKGITCLLNGVQFIRDGEPLGGGVTAAEAFGAPSAAVPTGYKPATPAYGAAMPATPGQGYPSYPPQQAYAPAPTPAYQYPPQQAAPVPYPGGYPVDPVTGQPLTSGMPIMGV